jgi:exodeoxyribonuclease V beta subunit
LTTIHKSKGLEYPIVVCPFLGSATLTHGSDRLSVRFHDQEGNSCIDLGSEDQTANLERMKAEVFAENLRLLYVALTRAQHRCVVFWGRFKGYENSALGYLVHRREIHPRPDQPPTELVDSHTAHLKALDDAAALATLRELTQHDPGTAIASPLIPKQGEQFQHLAAPEPTLTVRLPLPSSTPHLRTASFSELTALSHTAAQHFSESEKLDPVEQSQDGLVYASAAVNAAASSEGELTTLVAFPGGARTGNFFHTVLEHQDFEAPIDAALVTRTLIEHGLSTDLEGVAIQALNEVLSTPVESGLRLKDIPKARRLDELEFLLPVRHATGTGHTPLTALTRGELARVFAEHPSEALPADYAGRVRELEFLPLKGFLKGFVDLVFLHQKRWYLVDYKTNRLGDKRSDYTPQAIGSNMSESHYCLQYHLYTLALDRHLRYRVPAYKYDKHFGGVFYLYLRGMHPETGARYGVYFERPPLARLEALSRCFGLREGQAL